MNLRFESVNESHLEDLLNIYNYYVLNSTATFQIKLLNIDEMRAQVIFQNPKYHTYVIIDEDNSDFICGYVSINEHKKREAFNVTGELAVYLSPDYMRRGLGSMAISFIEKIAREKNFHSIIATISGDNTRSIELFEKMGFERCAYYKEVGKKFNKFLDLVAFQKVLE
jgi:phosphinothricin acetyltransferase